jgi:hypothetical protein
VCASSSLAGPLYSVEGRGSKVVKQAFLQSFHGWWSILRIRDHLGSASHGPLILRMHFP